MLIEDMIKEIVDNFSEEKWLLEIYGGRDRNTDYRSESLFEMLKRIEKEKKEEQAKKDEIEQCEYIIRILENIERDIIGGEEDSLCVHISTFKNERDTLCGRLKEEDDDDDESTKRDLADWENTLGRQEAILDELLEVRRDCRLYGKHVLEYKIKMYKRAIDESRSKVEELKK